MNLNILLLLSFIPLLTNAQQAESDIDFVKEDITFSIFDTIFSVNGNYYFKNKNNITEKISIFYPIYKDSLINSFYFPNVFSNTNNKPITFSQNDYGISFSLIIPAASTECINISYQQSNNYDYVTYILTSTNKWGKPLEEVNYKLIYENSIKIDSLSYLHNKSICYEKKNVLLWHKMNFVPQNEFFVKFTKNDNYKKP